MNVWYDSLERPPLTPPDGIFGPVWTVLYLMIAAACVLYFRASREDRPLAMWGLLAAHLAANFAWTPLFFGLQQPGWALIDLLFMDVTLLMLLPHLRGYQPWAARLLIPYGCWIGFATYLNIGFWWLNR